MVAKRLKVLKFITKFVQTHNKIYIIDLSRRRIQDVIWEHWFLVKVYGVKSTSI